MNVCIFSKYRHIFGKENEGIHSYRLLNVSIIDYMLTIVFHFFDIYYNNTSRVNDHLFFWFGNSMSFIIWSKIKHNIIYRKNNKQLHYM